MNNPQVLYCRFCAEQKQIEEIIDLKANMKIHNEIVEKLIFLNVNQVDLSNRTLPKTVCTVCYNSINAAYEFFVKINISQEVLRNLFLQNLKTERVSEEDSDHNYEDPNICVKLEDGGQNENHTYTYLNDCFNTKFDSACPSTYSEQFDCNKDVRQTSTAGNTSTAHVSWCSYPWICVHCKMACRSMGELREHSKIAHGTCFGLQCVDCDDPIEDFDGFIEHARMHREGLSHCCQYCNMKLEGGHTEEHMSTHTSQPICSACGETFPDHTSLQEHLAQYQRTLKKGKLKKRMKRKKTCDLQIRCDDINIENWQKYTWICQFCNIKFPDQNTLRNHTKEVHKKCFGMKCLDCESIVQGFNDFVKHVCDHRPNLMYYCPYCNYKYDDTYDSILHINDHLDDKTQCEVCGELFHNRTELNQHTSSYNPPKPNRIPFKRREKPITVDDLTCDICHKVSKSLTNLRAHKKLHTQRNRDHTCDKCGKAFFTKGSLSTHIIIHDNPKPEICRICKKSFLTLTRLKKHVQTHYGEKPFQCDVCDRRFRLKEQLKGHMITHTDLMPYQCQYCSKTFRHKNVMKNHENQHTGARPYICDVCDMHFANWSNCNKHMKRKHGTTLAKNIMTPLGKLPINPKTGKPKKVKDLETVKDWTEQIMEPCKRGKKSGSDGVSSV